MNAVSNSKAQHSAPVRSEPLSLPLPDTDLHEDIYEMTNASANVLLALQQCMEVVQQVMAVRGTERYAKV